VALERARFLLHPAQVTLLDRLLATMDLGSAVSHQPDPPLAPRK